MGKFDLALQNCQKAVEIGTKTSDKDLDQFKDHLKRVTATANAKSDKAAVHK
jgi:hypothetical protein